MTTKEFKKTASAPEAAEKPEAKAPVAIDPTPLAEKAVGEIPGMTRKVILLWSSEGVTFFRANFGDPDSPIGRGAIAASAFVKVSGDVATASWEVPPVRRAE